MYTYIYYKGASNEMSEILRKKCNFPSLRPLRALLKRELILLPRILTTVSLSLGVHDGQASLVFLLPVVSLFSASTQVCLSLK